MNIINDVELFYFNLSESFQDMNDKIVYGFPERIFLCKTLILNNKDYFFIIKGRLFYDLHFNTWF